MSIVATAVVVGAGAAITAGTTIAASEQAKDAANKSAKQYRNMAVSGYNPATDPVLNASSMEALFGLGASDVGVANEASLLTRVLDTATRSGNFNKQQLQKIGGTLANLAGTGQINQGLSKSQQWDLTRALRLSGYNDPAAFAADAQKQAREAAEREARMAPVRAQVEQGRLAAYSNLAKLAQDYPTATQEDILSLAKQYEDQIRRKSDQDASDLSQQILQSANVSRGNPAATLGRLAQEQSNQRFQAPTTALERAIALLSGRQNLGSSAINAYQALLNPAQNYAAQVANLRTNAAQNAVNAQMGQNAYQTQGVAQGLQQAGEAKAQGLASAGSTIGGAVSSIGTGYMNNQMLAGLLAPKSGGPGAGGTTGDPSRDAVLNSFLNSLG